MYLSDREMEFAIKCGRLIVNPPTQVGPTSIDLHLDSVEEAKVWALDKVREMNKAHGYPELELRAAQCEYGKISQMYLVSPADDPTMQVFRRGKQIVIKPGGFLLWQTREIVGTPEIDPDLICFIDGKSTRARTGLVVHLTAPTIHAGWSGKVTLEMTNLGPLHIALEEGDVVAQITVSSISSIPKESMRKFGSTTHGQAHVTGKGNMQHRN